MKVVRCKTSVEESDTKSCEHYKNIRNVGTGESSAWKKFCNNFSVAGFGGIAANNSSIPTGLTTPQSKSGAPWFQQRLRKEHHLGHPELNSRNSLTRLTE
jgi:hypothetical protein